MGWILVLTLFGVSLGAVHKVGDSTGWTSLGNIDYTKWASSNTFHVGDSLVFEYNNKFHNVIQVREDDFQSCNATSAIASYTSGSDSVTLKRPGHYYFLCAVPGHCQAGQKVDVLVKSSSLSPTATPTPTLASTSTSPSPSPSYMLAPGPGLGPAQSSAFSHAPSNRSFALAFILFAISFFVLAF